MESNSLMMYDLIQYDKSNFFEDTHLPMKVKALGPNWVRAVQPHEDFTVQAMGLVESEINPIPLTLEILQKNPKVFAITGFNFATDGSSINGFFLKCNSVHIDGILAVHELQHALRMAGLNDLANNLQI